MGGAGPPGALPSALHPLVGRLRERLIAEAPGDPDTPLERRIAALVDRQVPLLAEDERAAVRRCLRERTVGLGPLEGLLADPAVEEVMVNGPASVWVERGGRIEPTEVAFAGHAELMHAIERILSPLGRRVDEGSPFVDARLPDGSRVNVVIPPLAPDGAVLTIRRFTGAGRSALSLVASGTLTAGLCAFLAAAVRARLNVLVSGGTGSGKTTTLGALSGFVPEGERIVSIEDAAELRLAQRHVVRLESRPANLEGRGEVTIRALVRNALRMRPDRIIVGEVRGAEALDMLAAMTSGHDGSLSTVHASSPQQALSRIETLALMAGIGLPLAAVREQVLAAVDLIVHQVRAADGARRVSEVCHVVRGPDGPRASPLWRAGVDAAGPPPPLPEALAARLGEWR